MSLVLTVSSIKLPFSRRPPSTPPARHLVGPGDLSQRRHRPLSSSATAAPVLFLASAARPLISRSSRNNQSLDKLWETDGGGDRDRGDGNGGTALGHHDGNNNRKAAIMVLPRDDWPPVDPEAEDQAAVVPGSAGSSSSVREKFPLLKQLGGLTERLLSDDVLLVKVAIECGLGVLNKNLFKEPEIVFADVAMALMSELMLVHLPPAPTASLTPSLLARLFHGCTGNAFQIALPGSSYSLAQRLGALALNGIKLFALGTTSSMARTAVRNALIDVRKVASKSSGGEVEDVLILSAGVADGVYMAISLNFRSQVLDGGIEQHILEPLLHQHKLVLRTILFAIRTGNTFLGSLLWTEYARLIGIQ